MGKVVKVVKAGKREKERHKFGNLLSGKYFEYLVAGICLDKTA